MAGFVSGVTALPSTASTTMDNHPNPPSPTLTNPDMILPYEPEPQSSTPSPPFRSLKLPSPDRSALQGHSASRTANYARVAVSADVGVAVSLSDHMKNNSGPPQKSWVYAGHEVQPPLSDIGEEDSSTQSLWSEKDDNDDNINNNNNDYDNGNYMTNATPADRTRQWGVSGGDSEADCDATDTCSSSSSSTVGARSDVGEQRYSSNSRNNNNNQVSANSPEVGREDSSGDVHGSVDPSHHLNTSEIERRERMMAIAEEDEEGGNDGEMSSAMLGKEAERILENAKMRLTVCRLLKDGLPRLH